jgi:large subunit ribosomal protein L31
MKCDIHPKYEEIKVVCSCGNTFTTRSTIANAKKQLSLEVCSNCHPYYTGKHKKVDSGGRVERFQKKYGKKQETKEKTE